MFRIRIVSLLAAMVCICALAGTAAAAELTEADIYCFSLEDFSQDGQITGICLTDLPEKKGTLLLGSRVLRAGDILTADQVAQMTFSPLQTETAQSIQVGYLPIYPDRVAGEARMTIGIRGKEDKAPIAEDASLETYKNLPISGKLKVSDPEGMPLSCTITREPKRGEVTLGEDGSFTYTPKKNKVGVDSFTYTASDPAGKVSREATVTITILKPTEAALYTDTVGKECRFAAEWMKNTGIFVGETLGESSCFSPEKAVTRGEFVTMLVKALEIPTDPDVVYTGYEDEIPKWLQPYVAAALRSGLTAGLPDQREFGADQAITGAEASVMLENALELTAAGSVLEGETVPVWAENAVAVLEAHGISLGGEEPLSRGETAMALYQASRLMGDK